jgi:hypothetical protein
LAVSFTGRKNAGLNALGGTPRTATETVALPDKIHFDGAQFRHDIAAKAF